MADKVWKLLPKVHDDLFAQLLHNRGIITDADASSFFSPTLDKLADPFKQFPELKKALKRIQAAIDKKENIYIYGDYDVDGLTSTAIMWENLKLAGAEVLPYIPHRETEGYGLNKGALQKLRDEGASLIITVDCGITGVEEARFAKELGLDLIITDHHRKPEVAPECFATVHTTDLCGAGIAFKIAVAMDKERGMQSLDLAALGTVADLQPLTNENRIITKYGIEQLRQNRRLGLNALYTEAKIDTRKLKAWDISFLIAPRLNAIGRMEHAIDGLRLLLTKNPDRAVELADVLKKANKSRQDFTTLAVEEARALVKTQQIGKVCLVVGDAWKEGVIGLVAARLVEEVALPVVAITKLDGYAKGSARSYNGYNIIEAITKVGHLLVDYGGHPGAAGFTVKTEQLEEFCSSFSQVVTETYTEEVKLPEIEIEAELRGDDLSLDTIQKLNDFEPFGLGNTEPLFMVKQGIVRNVKTMSDGKHLKITVLKDGRAVEAVGFSMGKRHMDVRYNTPIDIVGTLKEDNWTGVPKVNFMLKDFRASY